MNKTMIALACLSLTGCQPADRKPETTPSAPASVTASPTVAQAIPGATASRPGWTHADKPSEVSLAIQDTPDAPPFTLTCFAKGPAVTLTAGVTQVGRANIKPPFAMVASGGSVPASLAIADAAATVFSVTAALTPDALGMIRDAVTIRILVSDGDAFAESAVDPGEEFETFAKACARLTGVVAPL